MVSVMSLKLKQDTSKVVGMMWVLALILLWGEVRETQAGCQRFGHSCFGAHGKRADITPGELSPAEMMNYPAAPEQQYYPAGLNNNRVMSPYLMEWIMSAHRGGQPLAPFAINPMIQLQDDLAMGDRRKK